MFIFVVTINNKKTENMKKTFKIGEYCIGGILAIEITDSQITVKCKDYNTKKVVRETNFNRDIANLRRHIDNELHELTSSYYADNAMKWIESKIDIPAYW